MNVLGSITIGMSPNIAAFGGLLLSWHGVFTFIAVATVVGLVLRWGTREGMQPDPVLSICVWSIIGGILGARLVHVIDFWGAVYSHNPLTVFYIWQGGIALYGGILGGFAGCAGYITIRNSRWFLAFWGRFLKFAGAATPAQLPAVGHMADVAAPAMLIGMAIGRIGDIINGEHFARFTSLPWGVLYTHPESLGLSRAASHPAVAYELIFDLLLVAVLWPLRHRLQPHGMVFALAVTLYSVGRFFLSFLREEINQYFLGLNEAQLVALLVVIVTIPLLVYKAKLVRPAPRSEQAAGR
ncbi:MAG: prolipoprotein diacylglyceryl transferase [Dehalococcoidia bacterium]|nr:prolipoprotein diacylglyceryl transferase [Dehalococcoidia bacterium]MSQ16379.1 prolipoprotein diacylglyceryl transferase [Dehalococcoidia bacterium]